MKYEVLLKEIPERKVVSIRKTVKDFSKEGELWEKLIVEVKKQQVQYGNPSLAMTLYHDLDYREEDVDIEVQMNVDGEYNNTEEVIFKNVPALPVVSVTYQGGYEQTPKVMQAIATWLEENAYVIDGPMINIFHKGPANESSPENWVTEACYVIKKKS